MQSDHHADYYRPFDDPDGERFITEQWLDKGNPILGYAFWFSEGTTISAHRFIPSEQKISPSPRRPRSTA